MKKQSTKLKKTKKHSDSDAVKVSIVKKRKDGKFSLTSFGKTVAICLSVIVVLAVALIISVNALINYYYNLMDYTDISKETVMGDEEISKYLEELEGNDPEGTGNGNGEGEVTIELGGAVSDIGSIKENISGITNILLIGVDNSGEGGKRGEHVSNKNTDSMILLTINNKNKRIVLTSLMRDSYVEVVKANGSIVSARLNTACLYGGYAGMFKTIERNFAIDVDRFVQVDFSSFMDIVDIIGGVDMYVTYEEAVEMNRTIDSLNYIFGEKGSADKLRNTSSGTKHLNGKQALAYARIRHVTGNDFGRTERQRKLIMEIVSEAKDLSVGQLNTLLTTVLGKVSTNLTQSEVKALMSNAVNYLGYDIIPFRIPADNTYDNVAINGASVLYVDFVKNYKAWKSIVTEK